MAMFTNLLNRFIIADNGYYQQQGNNPKTGLKMRRPSVDGTSKDLSLEPKRLPIYPFVLFVVAVVSVYFYVTEIYPNTGFIFERINQERNKLLDANDMVGLHRFDILISLNKHPTQAQLDEIIDVVKEMKKDDRGF